MKASPTRGLRILVLSRNIAGERMSAPGIRALNIARTLARQLPEATVTLAVPNTEGRPVPEGFAVVPYTRGSLPGLILRNEVIVAQYVPAYAFPFIIGKRLVLDFFANFIAEWLELWSEHKEAAGRKASMDTNRRYLNLQLSQADLVLAANERQRDLWLGALAAQGRVTPAVYDADRSLRSLVDVVPFGVRPEPAVLKKRVLKGVYPGIGPQDRVLIWNGGILHWYDPSTLIHAFDRVSRVRPDVKLFFLGTKYPVDDPIEGRTLTGMLELSEQLGLTGKSVFFNEGWLPYDATADYLVESDIGVCTYFTNLETHFAYRVRLVDLIWAETPIICNQGDTVAGMVEERGLGLAVPQGDTDALAEAMLRLLDDSAFLDRCKSNLREVKEDLSWDRALAPLLSFCGALPRRSVSRSLGMTSAAAASYFWARAAQTDVGQMRLFRALFGTPPGLHWLEDAPIF